MPVGRTTGTRIPKKSAESTKNRGRFLANRKPGLVPPLVATFWWNRSKSRNAFGIPSAKRGSGLCGSGFVNSTVE